MKSLNKKGGDCKDGDDSDGDYDCAPSPADSSKYIYSDHQHPALQTYVNTTQTNSDLSANLSMINQQQFNLHNQNSYNDNDGGSSTSSSYSSQPSPDLLVPKKEGTDNSVRLMNMLNDANPLQQQFASAQMDPHLIHGLSNQRLATLASIFTQTFCSIILWDSKLIPNQIYTCSVYILTGLFLNVCEYTGLLPV